MRLQEIVDQENKNEKDIFLFREGIFYRAYNRSAMRFVENIKQIKILSKYIKYLKQDIYYCGFPHNSVAKLCEVVKKKGLDIIVDEKVIKIFNAHQQDENFSNWKKQQAQKIEVSKFPLRDPSSSRGRKSRQLPQNQKSLESLGLGSRKQMRLAAVVEKQYQLIIWFLPKLARFPKDQRFLLGDRIEKILLDVLELLIKAAFSKEKEDILEEANLKLECLRFLVRITKDMRYITVKRYDYFCGLVIEIGKMIGGWRKSLKTKEPVFKY